MVLVAHWKLDEGWGQTYADSAGGLSGVHTAEAESTLIRWPIGVPFCVGGFTGAGRIEVTSNESDLALSEAITVTGWMRAHSDDPSFWVLSYTNGWTPKPESENSLYSVGKATSGRLRWYWNYDAGSAIDVYTDNYFCQRMTGHWTFFGFTRRISEEDAYIRFYTAPHTAYVLHDQEVTESSEYGPYHVPTGGSSSKFTLCGQYNDSGGDMDSWESNSLPNVAR